MPLQAPTDRIISREYIWGCNMTNIFTWILYSTAFDLAKVKNSPSIWSHEADSLKSKLESSVVVSRCEGLRVREGDVDSCPATMELSLVLVLVLFCRTLGPPRVLSSHLSNLPAPCYR